MTNYNSSYSSSEYSSSFDETSSEQEEIRPIVNWVGGKKIIIDTILDNIPEKFNNYYEPFLGGGTVFLNIDFPKKAIINDFNKDLISLYSFLKKQPKELIKMINNIQNNYNKLNNIDKQKQFFLKKRKRINNLKNNYNLERAALYLFMNKACFNGFMQVNKYNNLTCSFGQHKKLNLLKGNNLYNFSKLLSENVSIKNGDYAKAISTAKKGDFVYSDSPYCPDDKTQCTINYNAGKGWSYDDYMRYFDTLDQLDKKGVYFMMSNSDSKMVRKWLKNRKYRVKRIPINRTVSASIAKRAVQKEVIVMNY